ncbi:MAG: murein L,D-transpeptidase [Nocardioidaceae bacterium]|nr:murein L,D-transpeptidase [Nocardioidaceae bacterium]
MGGLGYGVARATGSLDDKPAARTPAHVVRENPADPTSDPTPTPQPAPVSPTRVATPAAPAPEPKPPVLKPGDNGPKVRELQARLRQLDWFAGNVTDRYGPKTSEAVAGFQGKRGLPKLGYVDAATLTRLHDMTRPPTQDELANKIPDGTSTNAPLDARCTTGRVLCIDKSSRTVRWVVDGKVQRTMAVRFGASYTPTREGVFHVERKSRDHVSSLYGSAMPFAMFFSRGQAVHYSSDFAARGYNGASHGCVNVRDHAGIEWLFGQVHVGDKVVIYWS